MNNPDARIIRLIDVLIFHKEVKSAGEFCDRIGIHRQNISKIKAGKQGFTKIHIQAICNIYNVNANWIFGTQKNVFNSPGSIEITATT